MHVVCQCSTMSTAAQRTMFVHTLRLALGLSLLFISAARGQRCPDDWVQFHDSCYVFVDEYVPWATAKVFCETFGAKMLEVGSQAENDFIVSEMTKLTGFHSVWQGLTDLEREGRWVWNSNREEADYVHWQPGEPNNIHRQEHGEDCVEILPSGYWNDQSCMGTATETINSASPVCEIQ